MLASIQNWLEGDRDYYTGVKLFETHGGSSFLLTAFNVGSNSFTSKKLLEELIKINATTEIEIRPAAAAKVNTLPQDIATLEKEARAHFKDGSFLFQHLLDDKVATDEITRGNMAFKILQEEKLWKEKFKRVDYFRENGERMMVNEIPAVPSVILSDMDKAKLKQRQFTVRSYITKLRQKSGLTGKKLDRAQSNLQKYIIELDKINTLLNEPV